MPHTLIRPTFEEDIAITSAALFDPDAVPLTDAEWEAAKPLIKRGRPHSANPKERITIRLSKEVVEPFRAFGEGWQTQIDNALKEWLKTQSSSILKAKRQKKVNAQAIPHRRRR